DKARGEKFLPSSSLHIGGVEAAYHPTSVAIREISLTDFHSRIIVQPAGTMNVQGIIAKEDPGPDNTASKPAPAAVPSPPAPADNASRAARVPTRTEHVKFQGRKRH